jgi:hypothetical protein
MICNIRLVPSPRRYVASLKALAFGSASELYCFQVHSLSPCIHAHSSLILCVDEKEKIFCEELTELLHRHGLGIADKPHVYELENCDYTRKCSIDEDGLLLFY